MSILQDIKTAATVAGVTISSGVATVLEKIPEDIGKLATLTGIALSCVLIYTHIRKYQIDTKAAKQAEQLKDLQIEELRRQLERDGGK